MAGRIAVQRFGVTPGRTMTAHAPSPAVARIVLGAVVAGAVLAGFAATGDAATGHAVMVAGADLTRLLRAMAAIKAMMAAGVVAGALWRLGMAVGWARLGVYAASCAAMAAGPGLIWGMAHVGLGALLLHGGLLAGVVMLWRDPAVAAGLARLVAARRARHLGA